MRRRPRNTLIPRLMLAFGLGLVAMELLFEVHLIPEPNQTLIGGGLIFLAVVWYVRASGMLNRRP